MALTGRCSVSDIQAATLGPVQNPSSTGGAESAFSRDACCGVSRNGHPHWFFVCLAVLLRHWRYSAYEVSERSQQCSQRCPQLRAVFWDFRCQQGAKWHATASLSVGIHIPDTFCLSASIEK